MVIFYFIYKRIYLLSIVGGLKATFFQKKGNKNLKDNILDNSKMTIFDKCHSIENERYVQTVHILITKI